MVDPYLDSTGRVLRNLLDIDDIATLERAESDITSARLYELSLRRVEGDFDFTHLRRCHRLIFQDLYDWAGEVRTVEIAKGPYFCPMRNIQAYADDIFGRLCEQHQLRGFSRAEFVPAIAALYGDINALHPFREGNGRAQRFFLGMLAHQAGHRIAWERADRERNDAACLANLRDGDGEQLHKLLDDLVE